MTVRRSVVLFLIFRFHSRATIVVMRDLCASKLAMSDFDDGVWDERGYQTRDIREPISRARARRAGQEKFQPFVTIRNSRAAV